jgi:GT2 family glycosyltransferase
MPDALIITVSYRGADSTRTFLESVSRLDGFQRFHVIVVENGSGDGSVQQLRPLVAGCTNVELLESPQNRGYFGAAQWALAAHLAHHSLPDWVIVCNNDVVFDDPQFLRRLFEKNPATAGVRAPAIISALTGHDANPSIRQRPSAFRMLRYRIWLSNYYSMWLKHWLSPFVRKVRYRFSKRTPAPGNGVSQQIYAPHGSFLIFSRRFFEAGGFIDDGFFLYAEEFCVAEMCRHLGLPVIHDPELRVWHEEGQSTGGMLSRNVYRHERDGFRYALAVYKNSYSELGPARSLMRSTLAKNASNSDPISTAGDNVA